MTRIVYTVVLIEAVICISLRFLVRRFLENKPLVPFKKLMQPLDKLEKLMQSSWLSFVGVMSALVGFLHLNFIVESRLANQSWKKCKNAGPIEI